MKHALALVTLLASISMNTQAADLTAVGITAGIPNNCANVKVDEPFFKAQFNLYYDGGTVMLSANEDGTGAFMTDDLIEFHVVHADGTKKKFSHWFSDVYNGDGALHPKEPTDLTSKFGLGQNKVSVTLKDKYHGACVNSTPLWITVRK